MIDFLMDKVVPVLFVGIATLAAIAIAGAVYMLYRVHIFGGCA